MEEHNILSKEVIDFILKNEEANPYELVLKKSPFLNVDMKTIVQQIQGRKIAKKKFPFLLPIDQYRYPKKESLEQASSEITALYKSKLLSGKSFVDLTGGMGIDTYLLGRHFDSCVYLEPNKNLFSNTTFNFRQLAFTQCTPQNTTCEEFLDTNNDHFDWAYIDPSRRIEGSRKTSIHNYEPNLVELQHKIGAIADNIMVKLSPMQDISECLSTLENIHEIWVISIKNEVKELLLHIKKGAAPSPKINAVDIHNDNVQNLTSPFADRIITTSFGPIKTYLYQPSSAIVKAELQNIYGNQLGLQKLNVNTHLFTSDEKIEDYQGRVFVVKDKISLNKKDLKKVLPQMKANVITKNFPLSASDLIRKYKLKDGGSEYLIAFTDFEGNKVCLHCHRIH